jgi:hypothetical protein
MLWNRRRQTKTAALASGNSRATAPQTDHPVNDTPPGAEDLAGYEQECPQQAARQDQRAQQFLAASPGRRPPQQIHANQPSDTKHLATKKQPNDRHILASTLGSLSRVGCGCRG